MSHLPSVLALDFDGVLCDGLLEYFQVAWRTYCQIWQPSGNRPPDDLADRFYPLRPVIETGWEMPVLIHALLQEIPETQILQEWSAIAAQILQHHGLDAQSVATALDQQRDQWIAQDLGSWLALHRFYPGIIERLKAICTSPVSVVIVSTKEGRFIQQLLQRRGIRLQDSQIKGKETRLPKHQVLRSLLTEFGDSTAIWFIEDRLKTLINIQQYPELQPVRLYLADWGYNTQRERDFALGSQRIQLLSLTDFTQAFTAWPAPKT